MSVSTWGLGLRAAGAAGVVVNITDHTIFAFSFAPAIARAEIQLRPDGGMYPNNTGSYGPRYDDEWIQGSLQPDVGADFEARMTQTSGAAPLAGPTGWTSLALNRSWFVSSSVVGTASAVCTLEIRDVADQIVQDTAQITLTYQVEP